MNIQIIVVIYLFAVDLVAFIMYGADMPKILMPAVRRSSSQGVRLIANGCRYFTGCAILFLLIFVMRYDFSDSVRYSLRMPVRVIRDLVFVSVINGAVPRSSVLLIYDMPAVPCVAGS